MMEVDNNQNQTSGATPPQAPPQQPQTSTPQSPSQPSNPQMAPVSTEMPMAAPSGNGNTGKIFAIVAAILGVIILVAALVWFFIAYWPQAQAKSAANKFVVVTVDGDYDEAFELTNSDADQKQAVVGLIESLDSQLGDSGYKISKFEKVDDTYKITYQLTDDNEKWFRIELDSNLDVSGIYIGLRDVENVEVTEVSPSSSGGTETEAILACLAQDDYRWFFFNDQPSSVTYDETYTQDQTFNAQRTMFFEADSIVETTFSDAYDDWTEFATKNADKQWQYRIRGSVYLGGGSTADDAAGIELANERANEVKRELVSRGVTESRISVDSPIEHSDEFLEGFDPEIYRKATIIIDPTCTGDNQTSSGL